MSQSQPLIVETSEGRVVVSIGYETLTKVVQFDPKLTEYSPTFDEMQYPEVVDAGQFAKELVDILHQEDEDGTTLVHIMFDEAVRRAIESGAESVRLPSDNGAG